MNEEKIDLYSIIGQLYVNLLAANRKVQEMEQPMKDAPTEPADPIKDPNGPPHPGS